MYVELNISNNNRLIILYKYKRPRHLKNINNANRAVMITRVQNCNDTTAIRIVDYLGEQQLFEDCGAFLESLLSKNEYIDFYFDGLTGSAQSKKRRSELLEYLGLPQRMTTNAMIDIINRFMTYDEYKQALSLSEKR